MIFSKKLIKTLNISHKKNEINLVFYGINISINHYSTVTDFAKLRG